MQTEGISLEFSDEAIHKIAEVAYHVNQDTDNIGARRLHTILERLLEDLSFEAPDVTMEKITITTVCRRKARNDSKKQRFKSIYFVKNLIRGTFRRIIYHGFITKNTNY